MRTLVRAGLVLFALTPLALHAVFSRRRDEVVARGGPRGADNSPRSQLSAGWPSALDSGLARIVRQAPFRAARRAALVAFRADTVQVAPTPQPKPILVLRGILWGKNPVILLEGLPGGAPQSLLQVGDTVGGLRVQRILPTRAVVTGLDTTWVLTLPRSVP